MPTNLSHSVSSLRPVLFASIFAMGTFAASGYLKYKSSNTCMSSSWSFFKMFKKYTHSHNSFFYPIAAANVAVFGLWNWRGRSTRFLQGFLQEHFVYIHGVSSTFSLLGVVPDRRLDGTPQSIDQRGIGSVVSCWFRTCFFFNLNF